MYETLVNETSRAASLLEAAPPRSSNTIEASTVQRRSAIAEVEAAVGTSAELIKVNVEKIITG